MKEYKSMVEQSERTLERDQLHALLEVKEAIDEVLHSQTRTDGRHYGFAKIEDDFNDLKMIIGSSPYRLGSVRERAVSEKTIKLAAGILRWLRDDGGYPKRRTGYGFETKK